MIAAALFSKGIGNFRILSKTKLFQSIGICLYLQSNVIIEMRRRIFCLAKTTNIKKTKSRGVPLYKCQQWKETVLLGWARCQECWAMYQRRTRKVPATHRGSTGAVPKRAQHQHNASGLPASYQYTTNTPRFLESRLHASRKPGIWPGSQKFFEN